MKIAIGADHAGIELKRHIHAFLLEAGEDVTDLGTDSTEPVDYPDYAHKVARAVAEGSAERGILVCGTAIGMAMVANRHHGVRAAPCTSEYAADMARRHNNANVLTLGGRLVTKEVALRLLQIFLSAPFDGGRHSRRVTKIEQAGDVRSSGRADDPGGGTRQ